MEPTRQGQESGRATEYYKGFELIAAYYRNTYQARAFHWLRTKLEVTGCTSVKDALETIKVLVDSDVAENIELYQQKITEKHLTRLKRAGTPCKGTESNNGLWRRVSHCYDCKKPVDTAYDLACVNCGWIVCSNCGACGCEYRGA